MTNTNIYVCILLNQLEFPDTKSILLNQKKINENGLIKILKSDKYYANILNWNANTEIKWCSPNNSVTLNKLYKPGEKEGLKALKLFINTRLNQYSEKRNGI